MEDYKGKICVILAGYKKEMEEMIALNPGFDSRINRKIEFPDYTIEEQLQIFDLMLNKRKYTITEKALEGVRSVLEECTKKENFANAREVRNLFEKIITNQAARVSGLDEVDEETLSTITVEDLADLEKTGETGENGSRKLLDLIEALEDIKEKEAPDMTDEAEQADE
jgi:hypothetical protein